jgi:hypothetical protein
MTWHAYCAWWRHHCIRLMSSLARLLCMLMSQLHQADVIPCMSTVHDDVTCTSCWRHPYPSQSHGSVQLVFGSGQPIRVKKTRGAHLRAWANALPESDGECSHVRRPISTPFSPVASSTQWYGQNTILTTFIFEQKSNTTLNQMLWYQLLRKSDRRCTDNCSNRGVSTLTQYFTWFDKTAYIHGRG